MLNQSLFPLKKYPNFELLTNFISFQDTFTAVASDSGTVFNPVDLCDGEWYDYDEKESREVSITDIDFKIIQTK